MDVKATLEERVSSKSGNKYKALVIKLTDTYEKVVFLEKAELELLDLANSKKQNNDEFPSFLN